MTELITRAFQARADAETGVIEGIAVPWNETVDVGYSERFERGAITDTGAIKLFSQHEEIVGRVVESEDREEGFWIRAKVSDTTHGRDLLTLMRDGAIDRFSVGFIPVEERDEDGVTVRTKVDLKEVSAVTFPAYSLAAITSVRNSPAIPIKEIEMTDSVIEEVRESVETLERKFATFSAPAATPVADTRSAGAVLQAIVRGDEATITAYNKLSERAHDETLNTRATSGTTLADAPGTPLYQQNLIRLFDSASGVLSNVFGRGTLPATGNAIEFLELASNTLRVEQQVAEGDTLAFGKLTFSNRTAPVRTFGGYTELSRQVIERSSVPVLNTALEGLAIEAGRRKKTELRTAVAGAVAARTALASNAGVVVLGSTLAAAAAGNFEDALIDAAIRFDADGAAPEALIVSASVFKKLRSLTVSGERVFTVATGNASGTINLPGLTGVLAGLPVFLDPGQVGDSAYFVNGRAVRQYDSAVASLSDSNITNLTNQYSVYFYGAVAVEIPSFIVPLKLAAS